LASRVEKSQELDRLRLERDALLDRLLVSTKGHEKIFKSCKQLRAVIDIMKADPEEEENGTKKKSETFEQLEEGLPSYNCLVIWRV
jgi:hypothetical protein